MWRRRHAVQPAEAQECPAAFPQLWAGFVHAFVDALHAQGPAAPRPPHAQPGAAHPPQPPLALPAVPRLVAVGDLHGDLGKARRAFRLAGLIDAQDRWAGGTTTVVQVGDLLDRGDHELLLLFWLERLQRQAAAAGGAIHVLNGNHESMNVAGQYRYVTRGAMHSFRDWLHHHTLEAAMKARCGCAASAAQLHRLLRHQREHTHGHHTHPERPEAGARTAALEPGGAVTRRFFAPNPVVLQVGSTVFAHGGVLRHHVDYGLERMNREAQEWMLSGRADKKPKFLSGRTAVVWSRHYSAHDNDRCDCEQLAEVLGRVPGAQRMVVGHTIQEGGITSACQGRVLRIDVGLSRGCGDGSPEVLEILDDRVVRRLSEVQQENVAPVQQQGMAPAPMASRSLVAVAIVLLAVQTALAQQCGTERTAAQEAACPDDAFVPKSCRSALMGSSTAYRAYVAAWMASVAYDKADGVSWETAARRELARWRFSDIRFGAQGGIEFFVADAPDNVYLVFRGTDMNQAIDWKTNLRTEFITVTGLGQVHKGFWQAFTAVHEAFKDIVTDFRAGRKGIVYAGHSLGAAIATLAAASRQYRDKGSVANVFTFGSPKVGDATWAASYSNLGLDQLTFRYVNDRDPVALVPPGGSIGYRHVGRERRMFSSSSGDCKADTALVCPSGSKQYLADGILGKLADAACNGNGFVIGAANIFADLFTDISFSASDLLAAEPGICCADLKQHDMPVYSQRLRGGCMDACDRLIDCSCRQDEPQSSSTAAPSPAGATDLVLPSHMEGVSADMLEPVQEPQKPSHPDTASYRVVVQTSCALFAGTTAYLEVLVRDGDGRQFRSGYLDGPGKEFQQCNKDVFDVGTGNWVELSTITMQVYFKSRALFAGGWQPGWIQVIQNPGDSDNRRTSDGFCYGGKLSDAGWYTLSRCSSV
ncbi:shewanella phosphatase 2 [Chlorella sorokiniana]|uniref:Shewanella phosphatase 2 n=1 Tax=Chlorella sorokiniana TaxID=3076 RepID=A0A2P6TQZ3_CHLSO|nr:shewanella phosphatase 2 [Chlorella sorokiniana]|eukprot:PRW56463.1 shewanella phosphatase 2 [Chlorella sorokiniana]